MLHHRHPVLPHCTRQMHTAPHQHRMTLPAWRRPGRQCQVPCCCHRAVGCGWTRGTRSCTQVLQAAETAPKQAEVPEATVHKWPKRRSDGESEPASTSEAKRLLG